MSAVVLERNDAQHLVALEFAGGPRLPRHEHALAAHFACDTQSHRLPLHDVIESQLGAYFAGDLREFSLPLEMPGTAFQQTVWRALTAIPYGVTRSYGELAEHIGSSGGQRAVGAANGANRIAIVVPCHRVIESGGGLRGYGGGLDRKRFLLELEGAWPTEPTLFDRHAEAAT